MKKFGFILLITSYLLSCGKRLTVEETAQQWVQFYYNSEFEKAKFLSTQVTKNMIDSIALELLEEEEVIAFEIVQMSCTVNGDSAICSFIYKDHIGEVEEKIHLLQKNNKWLVDESLSGEPLTNEEMEQIFDEYEEMLKEDLQNTQENE